MTCDDILILKVHELRKGSFDGDTDTKLYNK